MVEESFCYVRERREFGRQCFFVDESRITIDMRPDPELMRNFIPRDPVDKTVQKSSQMAFSDANTEEIPIATSGINHYEGGWPKDVNPLDEEQTYRFRKRIERDESYVSELNELLGPMKHYLNQNNVGNIYENFFVEMDGVYELSEFKAEIGQAFVEIRPENAAVSSLSFSMNGQTMAASYCNLGYQSKQINPCFSHIWDIENPNVPITSLTSVEACSCIEYNERDEHVIAGGLLDGRVCIWDPRVGQTPQLIVKREFRHRERVNDLLWQHSKTNSEFFSGGGDGQIHWWDCRKLNGPFDSLMCDPLDTDDQNVPRSYGVSVLEYEYTIPTRFMVGTEMGYTFMGNRKGRLPTEKIMARFQTNQGPIRCLQRNPAFTKNLLILGDYSVKIWNEDFRKSPIMWTESVTSPITCGTWSPTRYSMFAMGRSDGILDFWDLFMSQKKPTITVQASSAPLTCIKAHETGRFFACGDTKGRVQFIDVSDPMTFNLRSDKGLISAMFDREAKREKFLDAKRRENVLKRKQMSAPIDAEDHETEEAPVDLVAVAEQEFNDIVLEELKRTGRLPIENPVEPKDENTEDAAKKLTT